MQIDDSTQMLMDDGRWTMENDGGWTMENDGGVEDGKRWNIVSGMAEGLNVSLAEWWRASLVDGGWSHHGGGISLVGKVVS